MSGSERHFPQLHRCVVSAKDTIQRRYGHLVNFPEAGTIEKVGVLKIGNIDENAD
jgi:hypothetical protein